MMIEDYLVEQSEMPFEWGASDCITFAAGMVERLTGRNPAAAYRYSSERDALRLIADAGGLAALITAEMGDPRPSIAEAVDGDVVLTTFADTGDIVGIAQPSQRVMWLRLMAGGLVPVPFEQVLKVWPCLR